MICWRCHSNSVNTGSRLPRGWDVKTRKTRNVVGIDMIRNNRIDFCGLDKPCRAKQILINIFIGNFTILTQLCDCFVLFWPFLFVLLCDKFFFTMKNGALLFVEFLCVVQSNVTSLNLSFKSVMVAEQAVRKEFRLKRVEMSTCNQCQLHAIV
jgi:hypothetical protein